MCALLLFFVPLARVSALNAVWIAVFMWGYYFFFTLYMIPHNALIPELIQDGPARVNAYTVSSFFFVTGSALGYVSPLIVSLFKNAGLTTLSAWRTTFGIYTAIGIVLLLIPAYTIREKDYVRSILPNITLAQSLRHAFSNRHFRIVTLGQLLENTGMAFFQACIMYYVTSLMGLAETYSVLILAISIAGSLLMYPMVNKFAKSAAKAPRPSGLHRVCRGGDRHLLQRCPAGKPACAGVRVCAVRVVPVCGAQRAAGRDDGGHHSV